jgi:hypothetical protein
MTVSLNERQLRLFASYRKNRGYTAPELQDEALEDFIDDLVKSERRRIAGQLEDVLLKGVPTDWRSRLLAVVTRLSRGEP